MGQSQKEREQEKKPHTDGGLPDMEQIEIVPIDDLMEELKRIRERERQNDRCNCYGDRGGGSWG